MTSCTAQGLPQSRASGLQPAGACSSAACRCSTCRTGSAGVCLAAAAIPTADQWLDSLAGIGARQGMQVCLAAEVLLHAHGHDA